MAATEAQVAVAGLWLDQYVNAAEQTKEAAARAAQATWLGFDAWYSTAAVAGVAAEMARMSTTGQDIIVGSAQQFIANVVAALRGTRVVVPPVTLPPARQGDAPPELVHTRPAEAYRKAIAVGKTHDEAVNVALRRAANVQVADLSLRERSAQQALMRELGITQFRRIVRPELSETGSCGLCIAAADRVYNVATLMPIHPPSCKCKTMPIDGDNDPGMSLNREDLNRLYADAGGDAGPTTNPDALRRTRYQVNMHGEYGPVLTRAGDDFRGPARVALEDDPERARRMLDKTLPVLARLEAAGGPEGPLQYQRDLVAKLTGIAGS